MLRAQNYPNIITIDPKIMTSDLKIKRSDPKLCKIKQLNLRLQAPRRKSRH